MARKKNIRPTDAELRILNVLWRRGPCTVHDVQQALSHSKPTGYTTALKLMQIMHEKGLLKRDETRRPHIYRPQASMDRAKSQMLSDFIERVFEGSTQKLVAQALSAKRTTPEELQQIRDLLDEIEGSKS